MEGAQTNWTETNKKNKTAIHVESKQLLGASERKKTNTKKELIMVTSVRLDFISLIIYADHELIKGERKDKPA